jgi:phosphoglycerate dehydrogenase-like enzyme
MTIASPAQVLILDDYLACAERLGPWAGLAGRADIRFVTEPIGDPEALVRRLAGQQVVGLMRERTAFGVDVIAAAPDLRMIATSGMANAAIDLEAATRAGVIVSGTASLSHPPIEMTWALILALVRGVPREDAALRAGRWQTHLGVGLRGRRLGVLGLGRIGAEVAKIGLAFGMDVVAWSEHLTAERADAVGVRLVSRDVLLETSDVVTVHLRLSERTRGLLGREELARMQRSAFLVNTSRGPIVDEAALIDALQRRGIAGAALDVFWEEPLARDHPLVEMDQVVLTPHLGYVTEENMRVFFSEMVADIEGFLDGRPVRVLNPEVLTRR